MDEFKKTDIYKLIENFSNRIFVTINHTDQYSEGVTGANRYVIIHVGIDGTGYKNKTEAKLSLKGTKYKTKIDVPNKGYGALGNFYSKPLYLKGSELISLKNDSYRTILYEFI